MRYFSVEEANGLVPFLQRTFEKVRTNSARAGALTHALAARGDRAEPGTPVPDELPEDHRRMREERDGLVEQIREAIGSVVELGIEVKRIDGLVDFRARRTGRAVHLCWRFGEKNISHWHELEDGYAGRQPIRSPQAFERVFLN